MADEKVLLVRLGSDLYGLPVGAVEEVLPALPIERVPHSPSFLRGVIFVRGHLIPVLSAAERLGATSAEAAEEQAIVCLRVGQRLVGVEFDEAIDLMDVADAKPVLANELGARAGFFAGVFERDGTLIRLLDPEQITSPDEILPLTPDPSPPSTGAKGDRK